MAPDQLRQANIEHFRRVLDGKTDPAERAQVERLLAEERVKPDSAYPAWPRAPRA